MSTFVVSAESGRRHEERGNIMSLRLNLLWPIVSSGRFTPAL
jgi:hypothetical protein